MGAGRRWEICVDTGGTFTDCLARDPDGGLHRVKVLSTSRLRGRLAAVDGDRVRLELAAAPDASLFVGYRLGLLGGGPPVAVAGTDRAGGLRLSAPLPAAAEGAACELLSPEEAPILAVRLVTGRRLDQPLPRLYLRLATTRGTNALLERRGAPTALFITRGFGDLLSIGNQQRPELFALRVIKPEPLYAAVVEVDERLDADGDLVRPLDLEALAAAARPLVESGVTSAAVALMHSYRRADHERRAARCLRETGFRHVSCSAELAPFIRLVPRAQTTVVDAYLAEAIEGYLERVAEPLAGGTLHVMTSAGGLMRREAFRPRDSLLSGPAGGAVGAAAAGRASGFEQTIAFDMGGTSTDVTRHAGDFDYRYETAVGDVRLLAPALAIETVAAGGGSVCMLAGGRLRVGPRSAGASPGPACYGAGGPLTLTDANLLLGRLDAEGFEIPLDVEAAAAAAAALAAELDPAAGDAAREVLLAGCLEIADERMAEAVRRVSIREGHDPAGFVLVAFGGAGPQHACGVARRLGIDRCLVPADAGLLSAAGLAAARLERFAERQVLAPLSQVAARVPAWLDELAAGAARSLRREGVAASEVEIRRRPAELRLSGQDSALVVEAGGERSLAAAFRDAYRERYGYAPPARPIELVSLRVVASARRGPPPAPPAPARPATARPVRYRRAHFAGGWRRTPVFARHELAAGARFEGPALVFERHSATVVEPGWRCRVDDHRALVLESGGGPG